MDIWERMYEKAREQYHPEDVTPFIYVHHVVCALEAEGGEIYVGFCVESCSGMPCGACREFFYQLDEANEDMEIMVDYHKRETIRLKELLPNWWGKERYDVNRSEYQDRI